jgi:hypothetical protein
MEEQLKYLEQERLKLWDKLSELEKGLSTKISDYEIEAKVSLEKIIEIRNSCNEADKIVSTIIDKIKIDSAEIEKITEAISNHNSRILEYLEESNNNNTQIDSLFEAVQQKTNKIQSNILEIEKIFETKSIIEEKLAKLDAIYTKGDDYDSKLTQVHKSIVERKKEIDELYYEVFGYSEKNENGEEIFVDGLKNDLEKSFNDIKSNFETLDNDLLNIKKSTIDNYEKFKEEKESQFDNAYAKWTADHKKIFNKIESLLPNALTVGLSFAYSEKKVAEESENIKHSTTFKWAIAGMILVSLIPFTISIVSLFEKIPLETVIYRIPRLVLAILPIYVPILWVAYSANRKMNLAKRLIEEYSHKEVLSKTFEGLSKQIENIDDKDISADLRVKLLYNILEVNSENPGKLISDYNKSDHPLMDALDKSVKLTNAVTKLSKIPGFTKLASSLEKKAEKILEDESKKAECAIESVVDDISNPKN